MNVRAPEERFWVKVLFTDCCWLWQAGRRRSGYGSFGLRHCYSVPAHRWAYEFCVGPIPAGLTLDHLCRNRACVNPDHLEPVTRGENVLRGISPSALAARKTHCPQGHPYDLFNTYISPRGDRRCRTCRLKVAT